MTIETVAKTAEADAAAIIGELKPAVSDIKTLIATKVGDVAIGLLVLAGVWIGHIL